MTRADIPVSAEGPQTATDAEDAFADAVQQLRLADAAVVRARQQAVAAYRGAPPYVEAAKEVDRTFAAFAEKRTAMMTTAEQHDPRLATLQRQAADRAADVAAAGQNPATTPEQFNDLLNQQAVFLKQLAASEDDMVNRDADAKRLRQQWTDACGKLRDLQDRQPAAVEASPAVRSAEAAAAVARSVVDRTRSAVVGPAASDPAEPTPDELVRRYPRYGLGWNDAWLTYNGSPAGK